VTATRSAILTTAWRLFAVDGLDGISMRRIAERVRVTPMALYRHFPSKEAIVDALVAQAFARWEERVAAITARKPRAWLQRFGAEYVDFALDQPRHFEAAFLLRTPSTRRYPDDFASGKSPAFVMGIPRIEACIAAGLFRPAPPLEIAMSLWGHAHGLLILYRTGRFAISPAGFRALYLRSLDRLFEGIEQPRTTVEGRHEQTRPRRAPRRPARLLRR
jgi:AcrR family transcriptional regulator